MKSILKIVFFFFLFLQICFAGDPALVIIDMQPAFVTRYKAQNHYDNPNRTALALERIVELIHIAKSANAPIVVVEFAGYGDTNQLLVDAIGEYKNFLLVEKRIDNVFSRSRWKNARKVVKDYLDRNNISDLVMTGANGGACVKCSIFGGIKEGYRIWTDPTAIIDFNSRRFRYPCVYKSVLSLDFIQPKYSADIDRLLVRKDIPKSSLVEKCYIALKNRVL